MEAFTAPQYFVSVEESARVACFLLDQEIGPEPNMDTKFDVYFLLVLFPSQSKLVKPTKSN